MADEAKLQKWLKKEFGEFVERIEPGIGGQNGFADVLLTVADGGRNSNWLVPVELKSWKAGKRGRLNGHKILPSQALWHRKKMRQGVKTFFLIDLDGRKFLLPADLLPWEFIFFDDIDMWKGLYEVGRAEDILLVVKRELDIAS